MLNEIGLNKFSNYNLSPRNQELLFSNNKFVICAFYSNLYNSNC